MTKHLNSILIEGVVLDPTYKCMDLASRYVLFHIENRRETETVEFTVKFRAETEAGYEDLYKELHEGQTCRVVGRIRPAGRYDAIYIDALYVSILKPEAEEEEVSFYSEYYGVPQK